MSLVDSICGRSSRSLNTVRRPSSTAAFSRAARDSPTPGTRHNSSMPIRTNPWTPSAASITSSATISAPRDRVPDPEHERHELVVAERFDADPRQLLARPIHGRHTLPSRRTLHGS